MSSDKKRIVTEQESYWQVKNSFAGEFLDLNPAGNCEPMVAPIEVIPPSLTMTPIVS